MMPVVGVGYELQTYPMLHLASPGTYPLGSAFILPISAAAVPANTPRSAPARQPVTRRRVIDSPLLDFVLNSLRTLNIPAPAKSRSAGALNPCLSTGNVAWPPSGCKKIPAFLQRFGGNCRS